MKVRTYIPKTFANIRQRGVSAISSSLVLVTAALLSAGCQLDDIKHYGEKCIGMQAIYSNGELQCSAHDMTMCTPEYADALNSARCPTQDFKCNRHGGASICTSGCPGTQKMVICGGKCYLAKSLSVTYGSNGEEICALQCPESCPDDCDEYGACRCPSNCTQGCDIDGNCLPCLDFEQSYENDENQVCTKLVCQSGQFKPELSFNPDQLSCNKAKSGVGVCLNGQTECRKTSDKETLHLCTDGEWRDLEFSCDGGNLCAALGNMCIGDPIGQRCNAEGNSLEPCPGDVSCNASKTACGECQNGRSSCQGSATQTCIDGVFQTKSCGTGAHCEMAGSKATCVQNGCELGKKKCSNNIIYACENYKWVIQTACTCVDDNGYVYCSDGTEQCQAGTTKCENNTHYTCNAGNWQFVENCQNGCDAQSNTCAASSGCAAGSAKCENNVQYTCSGGNWQFVENCQNGCDAQSNICAASSGCAAGSAKCENNVQYTCSGGNWQFVENCQNGCDAQSNICAASSGCAAGSSKCENNVQYTCSGGNWQFVENCQNGCDAQSNICAASAGCAAGSSKCENNVQYTCSGGNWQFVENCQNGCDAQSNTCAASSNCVANETKCSGNALMACDDYGSWYLARACETGCNPSTKTCYPECTPGQKTCDGNVSVSCGTDGKWGFRENCPDGCNVSSGACKSSETCLNGDYRCESNTALNCIEGKWFESPCGYNTCVKSVYPVKAVCTGTCVTNSKLCGNNTLYECSSKSPDASDPAYNYANATFWVATSTSCECNPGEKACAGNALKSCNAQYKWESTTCPNGCDVNSNTCKSSACEDGAITCINNQFANCTQGSWGVLPECKNGGCNQLNQAICNETCNHGENLCYRINDSVQYKFECESGHDWWLINICHGNKSQCNMCGN
ncbi:MAG: hypothetical protein II180_09145 [Proteobacteria bacterium]|nr:hypothetical protein [Pseudomonadota bacterium]